MIRVKLLWEASQPGAAAAAFFLLAAPLGLFSRPVPDTGAPVPGTLTSAGFLGGKGAEFLGVRLVALLVAAGAGMAMAFQGTLDAMLGKMAGLWEATFMVNAMGFVLAGVLLFGFRTGDGSLAVKAPWYAYLGGFIGVLIIYGVARSIPPIGVAAATTAIILGQVFTAGILDYSGLFGLEKIPFNWYRILGALAMAGGAWLMLRK